MLKRQCDLCGDDIPFGYGKPCGELVIERNGVSATDRYHLCGKCVKELEDFIKKEGVDKNGNRS